MPGYISVNVAEMRSAGRGGRRWRGLVFFVCIGAFWLWADLRGMPKVALMPVPNHSGESSVLARFARGFEIYLESSNGSASRFHAGDRFANASPKKPTT